MTNKNVIMSLAKVIIAAAWVDGEITVEEVNSLKDLLFRMPHVGDEWDMHMTARDWAELEMYIDSPVDDAERARLIADLQQVLRKPQERQLALIALDDLIHADGVVTAEEETVAAEIRTALEDVNLSLFGQLGRLIQGPVARRSEAMAEAPNREDYLEEYIKNRVYYKIRQRLGFEDDLGITTDQELRKLSLAGGLMARVAYVDHVVTDDEYETMVEALQSWRIAPKAAALVAEVAVSEVSNDLDYFRLSREFFTSTTEEERISFLDILFAVAAADGEISVKESVEIRYIARSLNMTQQQFVTAKQKAESS